MLGRCSVVWDGMNKESECERKNGFSFRHVLLGVSDEFWPPTRQKREIGAGFFPAYIHGEFFLGRTPRLFWSNRDPEIRRVTCATILHPILSQRSSCLLSLPPPHPFFRVVGNKYHSVWKSWKSACSKFYYVCD